MTGFARVSGATANFRWAWEVKSVNAKGLDLRLRLPTGFDAIEAEALGPIRHILHIGIGGSALGPDLLIDALGRDVGRYEVAVVSNVDGCALEEAIARFDPHATLIALASNAYLRVTMPTYVAGFAIFIVGTRWLRIGTRVTDWLGRISYSVYLFHLVVFLTIEWWLLKQPAGSPWRTQALGVYVATATAIVLVVATLVYYSIEKPGIRVGHRLAARIGRERNGPR